MPTLVERFESKYEPIPDCGCWLWTGTSNGTYGLISFTENKKRRWKMAHRVSYELYRGLIPESFDALHKCDTPLCVNPNHLFLGKDKDNIADAIRKGRWNTVGRSKNCWKRKLTDEQVRLIQAGGSTAHFAKEFHVSKEAIKRVKNGKSFKHLR